MQRDEQISILLTKGVQEILPSPEYLRAKLEGNERLTVYAGFDPTAPTLHIGHAIALRKLRQFQELGHTIIFLVGDFTARIGDPDKLSVRKPLTPKEIKENMRLYKKQASSFIRFSGKNAATIKYNNRWLSKLKFSDLISIASLLTVDQMMKRDMFVRRAQEDKPIYLHEFFYPLMQGYDSVAMGVDGEVGGNDQLFNMMTGRTLMKQMRGREKFVITTKLLEDENGRVMRKSEGNMIALSDEPHDIFGKIMRWTDGMIVPGFELCTDYTPAQTETVRNELASGANPRDLKMTLAFEITKSVAGEREAERARDHFIASFQKGETPEEVMVVTAKKTLKETLLDSGLVASATELRTLVVSGAVSSTATNEKVTVEALSAAPKRDTYRIGKHRFLKID